MAGRPKTRARREAEQQAGAGVLPPLQPSPAPVVAPAVASIPDARSATNAGTHARARTRAREPLQSTTRAPTLGTATRAAIDENSARAVRSLATVIRPGMRLRLSRTRPTWAAGFLEDYPVTEGDSLATFFEHVRDEYGGQSYTVEVLAAGDVQAFEGALTVAGPPMERGRPINRAKWEGRDDEPPATRIVAQPPPPAFNLEGVVSLATLVLGAFQKHNSEQMGAVKEMVTQSRELVVAALGQREQRETRTSFAAQLSEIVEATTALDKVKKVITGPTPRTLAAPAEDDDMKLMARAAKKAFFDGVASHLVRGAVPAQPTPAPAPQPARRVARPAQKPAQSVGFIPDARAAGQPLPKN